MWKTQFLSISIDSVDTVEEGDAPIGDHFKEHGKQPNLQLPVACENDTESQYSTRPRVCLHY